MNYNTLKDGVLNFLESTRVPGGPRGAYRNGPRGEAQLIASTDAAFTLDHFGVIATLSESEKDEWADYLNGFQTDEGYYWDPAVKFKDLCSPTHRWDYVMGYFSRHALWALKTLGRRPRRELAFCERFVEPWFLRSWVAGLNWANIWHSSNYLLQAYCWLQSRAAWFEDSRARAAMQIMAESISPYMDPKTGYWGTAHGSSVANGLGGYIHITPIYWDLGVAVPHVEAAVDSTLSLQRDDGFFMGAAPYDFDGAYALANLTTLTAHRDKDIQNALQRAIAAYLAMRNPDGGFKDMAKGAFGIAPTYTTPAGVSGSTGTWMYSAAIGLAATVLDQSPLKGDWHFSSKIGHLLCAPAWPHRHARR